MTAPGEGGSEINRITRPKTGAHDDFSARRFSGTVSRVTMRRRRRATPSAVGDIEAIQRWLQREDEPPSPLLALPRLPIQTVTAPPGQAPRRPVSRRTGYEEPDPRLILFEEARQ